MVNETQIIRKAKMDREATYNGFKVVNYDVVEQRKKDEFVLFILALIMYFIFGFVIALVCTGFI